MSYIDAADPDLGVSAPTVTVRGYASIRSEPDEAVLWITLSALDDVPGTALADVSARTTTLFTLLNEVGVAKADRSTTGITVSEEFDHTEEKGRHSLGHRAISRISTRLSDPEIIGQLISETTGNLAARIDGPQWLISLDNPVRLEAARQAAADASRKAQAYAEGVGAKLGHLVRLSEPGVHAEMPMRIARTAASFSGSMPVEQGEHEVSASIEATFMLEAD
jgi:uncharacterized protein YggE